MQPFFSQKWLFNCIYWKPIPGAFRLTFQERQRETERETERERERKRKSESECGVYKERYRKGRQEKSEAQHSAKHFCNRLGKMWCRVTSYLTSPLHVTFHILIIATWDKCSRTVPAQPGLDISVFGKYDPVSLNWLSWFGDIGCYMKTRTYCTVAGAWGWSNVCSTFHCSSFLEILSWRSTVMCGT